MHDQGYYREEEFMLQVLRCFKGSVTASDDGRLTYVFEELMTDIAALESAAFTQRQDLIASHLGVEVTPPGDLASLEENIGEDPPIQEELWRFHYSTGALFLGAYNALQLTVFAWLVYAGHYREFVQDEDQLRIISAIVSVVRYLLWWLVAYAIFYAVWPLSRFIVMRWRNNHIRKRNAARALAVTRISNAAGI